MASSYDIISAAFSSVMGLQLSTSGRISETKNEPPSPIRSSSITSTVDERFNPFTSVEASAAGITAGYGSSAAATPEPVELTSLSSISATFERFNPFRNIKAPAAGITASSKLSPVATPKAVELTAEDAQTEIVELTVDDLFGFTYGMMPHGGRVCMQQPPTPSSSEAQSDDTVLTIDVRLLQTHMWTTVKVKSNSTVKELRQEAAKNLGLPCKQLMLFFDNIQLNDGHGIKFDGIHNIIILGLELGTPQQMKVIFKLKPSSLAPGFDYDFTDIKDDGEVYKRGQFTYTRPYGWKRCGVKVLGKYKDDKWLGPAGDRTESAGGEWPVSYHGTAKPFVHDILEDGYHTGEDDDTYHRFERGVYSSPALEQVSKHGYAKIFSYDGKDYKLVLQNRVNPAPGHLIIHDEKQTGIAGFPYWVSPLQDRKNEVFDVRPYGILLRKV